MSQVRYRLVEPGQFTPPEEHTQLGDEVYLSPDESKLDTLEALTLDNLDLPEDVTPIRVRDVTIRASGVVVKLGPKGGLERALSRMSSRVASVSRRG